MSLGLLESPTETGHLKAGRQGPEGIQPGMGTEGKRKWQRQLAQAGEEVSLVVTLERGEDLSKKKWAEQWCVLRLGE